MANTSYVRTLLQGLPTAFRSSVEAAFEYVLGNLRYGRCQDGTRAENLQCYALAGRTHATPNTEFSVAHGLGRAPYLLLPILPLDTVNAELVPLTVTRAADASRIYLSSSVADAPFRVLVEG